jgi:threonine aldolase
VLQPVDANELFVAMPEALVAALEADGFQFYRWPYPGFNEAVAIRLVTSYATMLADVETFAAAAQRFSACS